MNHNCCNSVGQRTSSVVVKQTAEIEPLLQENCQNVKEKPFPCFVDIKLLHFMLDKYSQQYMMCEVIMLTFLFSPPHCNGPNYAVLTNCNKCMNVQLSVYQGLLTSLEHCHYLHKIRYCYTRQFGMLHDVDFFHFPKISNWNICF